MNGFLRVFRNILHAMEAAAAISQPIISIFLPAEGALIAAGIQIAVGIEGVITTPGSGAQKAEIVKQSTQAAIGVVNSILVDQKKAPLSPNIIDVVQAQVKVAVDTMNGIANTVDAAK